MKSICFTGHRKINATKALKDRLISTLEDFIKSGVTDFYAGGAVGWDMLCEITVIVLRQRYPQIKLHLVLPCSNEEQTSKWSDVQKKWFYKILSQADTVEYTSERYTSDCMRIRNQRLVDMADCCVCYYDGSFRSGTGQTVRMAGRKGVRVVNMFEGDMG